jgi:hypothetical protein
MTAQFAVAGPPANDTSSTDLAEASGDPPEKSADSDEGASPETTATAAPTAEPTVEPTPEPAPAVEYVANSRDLYNCRDFDLWEQAQVVYETNFPGDPNHIDMNQDSVACETLKY